MLVLSPRQSLTAFAERINILNIRPQLTFFAMKHLHIRLTALRYLGLLSAHTSDSPTLKSEGTSDGEGSNQA
jgi:hypothetical protein